MTVFHSASEQRTAAVSKADALEALCDHAFCVEMERADREQFNRLTRLARNMFDAPIAVLTLVVDGAHMTYSTAGMDGSKAAPDMAFCDAVLFNDAPLAVSDARNHAEFCSANCVRHAPFLRSYFGAPLIDADGVRIGSLGIFDYEPRAADARLINGLVDLARIAVDELQLTRKSFEAEDARRQLIEAIEALDDGFILFDADDRLALFNSRMADFYPVSAKELIPGRTFEEIMRAALDSDEFPDAKGCEEAWLADRLKRHREASSTIEQQTGNGRWLRIVEKRTASGATVGFRVDITELKKRECELFELATRDSLTGTLTRRAILDESQREFDRISRYSGNCSVLIIDVDHFKGINDIFGHQTGDETLRAICNQVADSIREVDRLGRLGGEEFMVLLPDTPLLGAMVTAERLRREIDSLRIESPTGEKQVCVTASIGVAEYKRGESCEAMIARADQNLYQAKLNGRNCVFGDIDEDAWSSEIA